MTTRKRTGDEQPEDQPVEPNQDLPETEQIDENPKPVEPNQDLPDEKQPPRGSGNSRGRSEDAPGQQRKDPNTYPDPENPPHTP